MKIQPNFPSLLVKKQEIASRYSVSIRTVENLVRRGVLPCFRLGRSVRFSPEECDAAMRHYRFGPRHEKSNHQDFSSPQS